jgi:hypothetical protein
MLCATAFFRRQMTGAEKSAKRPNLLAKRPNLLIIGASSLTSPVAQTELVGAMLESKEIRMNIEGNFLGSTQ